MLVLSVGVLVLVAFGLLVTVTQVRLTIEQKTIAAERVRAANAIDLVSQSGPLTPAAVEMIGRIAGLSGPMLLITAPADSDLEVMPLLGEQGHRAAIWRGGRTPLPMTCSCNLRQSAYPLLGPCCSLSLS